MNKERIKSLNDKEINPHGKYVLYVMHSSIRIELNLALNYAIALANQYNAELYIVYSFSSSIKEINYKQLIFLSQALYDFMQKCVANGYNLIIIDDDRDEKIIQLMNSSIACIFDKGYLKFERENERILISKAKVKCIEIEDNLIVPIEYTTDKQEWAAHTIRPKLKKVVDYFLNDANEKRPILKKKHQWETDYINFIKDKLECKSTNSFVGGEDCARTRFYEFVKNILPLYSENRNEPSLSCTSRLSPYLHFGNISPLLIYMIVKENGKNEHFLEQLFIRRELSNNYVYFNDNYANYKGLPNWSQKTLEKHSKDKRENIYSMEQLQDCDTHDIYWNAAMHQMMETGYLENTMRMYWGKKILEWNNDPVEAYNTSLYLNNLYLLDGWDPNSYTGVGWCFGLHDRPWKERNVFGTVRYMNAAGLKRKYNMEEYVYLWK